MLPGRVLQFEAEPPLRESPKEPRLLAQPSIASTSSMQFGGERMIKARQGLLERQSLEESALMAQGEDLLASCKFFGFSCVAVLMLCQCVNAPSLPGLHLRDVPGQVLAPLLRRPKFNQAKVS